MFELPLNNKTRRAILLGLYREKLLVNKYKEVVHHIIDDWTRVN